MTPDKIDEYIKKKQRKNATVNIHFKDRDTITGMFIQGNDYEELKSKNFWRVVSKQNSEQWKETKDMNLARVFNGASFTRLSEDEV